MKPFKGEQAGAYAAEIEKKLRELAIFIGSTAADSRTRYNIPIGNDGRIAIAPYRTFYSDVDKDLKETGEGLKEWHGDVSDEMAVRSNLERDGERLEMLAYAIFYKNLRERFIVVRASHHDDNINKVDTILLDKETGDLVCAFDEVGDTTGVDYEKKQEAIRDRNIRGGAMLKYGLRWKDDQKTVAPAEVKNIPLFYIALPKDRIEKGIQEFVPSLEGQSEFERKLFGYFIAAISLQIQGLELYSGRLDDSLKKKFSGFKKVIEEYKTKRDGP